MRSIRVRQNRFAAVLALLIVLATGACGADDDEGDTSAGPETTEQGSSTTETTETPSSEPTTSTTEASTTTTGTDETTPAGEAVEACTLLTEEDAEEVLGTTVEAGRQVTDECEWQAGAMLVVLERLDLGYDYEDVDEWREVHQDDLFEPVEGVGDEAYFGKHTSEMSMLVGEELYNLSVVLDDNSLDYDPESDKEAEIEALTMLGERVVGRLG